MGFLLDLQNSHDLYPAQTSVKHYISTAVKFIIITGKVCRLPIHAEKKLKKHSAKDRKAAN